MSSTVDVVKISAYDLSTGRRLYGMALKFTLGGHGNRKLWMKGLESWIGPRLRLKDGTAIFPDGAGWSSLSFTAGEVVEIDAPAPPACAFKQYPLFNTGDDCPPPETMLIEHKTRAVHRISGDSLRRRTAAHPQVQP
jgi:hypothetical protein